MKLCQGGDEKPSLKFVFTIAFICIAFILILKDMLYRKQAVPVTYKETDSQKPNKLPKMTDLQLINVVLSLMPTLLLY